jgi:hypothetical protein
VRIHPIHGDGRTAPARNLAPPPGLSSGSSVRHRHQRIPPEQRPLVLADFVPALRDGAELAATFEVILDVTPRD